MPFDFTASTDGEDQLRLGVHEPDLSKPVKKPRRDGWRRGTYGRPGRPVGKADGYEESIGKDICNLIAGGALLSEIATIKGMPREDAIRDWLSKHADFDKMYRIAVEMRASARADELVRIARDATISDGLARRQIDVLKFLMAKEAPRRYGRPAEEVTVVLAAAQALEAPKEVQGITLEQSPAWTAIQASQRALADLRKQQQEEPPPCKSSTGNVIKMPEAKT